MELKSIYKFKVSPRNRYFSIYDAKQKETGRKFTAPKAKTEVLLTPNEKKVVSPATGYTYINDGSSIIRYKNKTKGEKFLNGEVEIYEKFSKSLLNKANEFKSQIPEELKKVFSKISRGQWIRL